jgi:CubicO group peptidase (beta-lactamase class C family)
VRGKSRRFLLNCFVYANGYGIANLEYNIPITPSTVFFVSSVSNQLTAFAIVLLAQQGNISLDDDIRKYIPEVPNYSKTITIRHFIHRTSGLRCTHHFIHMAGYREYMKKDFLKMCECQRELNFSPCTEYNI